MVLTAEDSGVSVGAHPAAIQEVLNLKAVDPDNPTTDERAMATKTARDRYFAVAFLLGADKLRYGTLVEEIENEYLRNKGNSSTAGTYPTTASEAYDYLCSYKKDPKNLSRLLGQNTGAGLNTGVAFTQDHGSPDDDNPTAKEQAFAQNGGANGGLNSRPKICRRWGTDGHNSIECDSGKDKVAIYRQSQQPNQGVSQLINAVDWDGAANPIDDEAQNWTFLNKAVHTSDGPIQCTEYNKNGSIAQIHKSTIFSQANKWYPRHMVPTG